MAAFDLITLSTDHFKKQDSESITIDFQAVQIGASNLAISEVGGELSFNDNPIIDVTSIEIGASGLKISESGGNIDVNNNIISGVAAPTADSHAANKAYVDGVAQGLDVKGSAKACTTANLSVTASGSGVGKTLTATANGVLSLDGVTTWTDIDTDGAVNDPFPSSGTPASRVLVKDQTTASDNGIYAVQDKGTAGTPFILVRATDFDENPEVTAGAFTFIEEGNTCGDAGFVLVSDDPLEIDVHDIAFSQFSGGGSFTGGDGINISGTVIEVDLEAAGAGTGGLAINAAQLRVDAGDGIELNANGVSVDIEAAGAGTGGLGFNGSQELQVNAGDGIELNANGVSVDLEAAGSGAGGLAFNGSQELRVDEGDGILLNANGVSVDLEAAGAGTGGLALNGSQQIQVDAGDGIELNANGVSVDLSAASGLEIASGELQVDLEAAGAGTGGLELNGNELRADAGDGIELTANGISADLEAAGAGTGGLAFNGSQEIQVNAGDGIELNANGVSVDLEAAGAGTGGLAFNGSQEVQVDAGDGIELNANGVSVDLSTTSGLEIASGELQVDLEAAGAGAGGLELNGNELRVDAGDGIELTANGVSVDVGDGLQIDSTQQVAADYSESLTNDNAGAITVRQVVYIKANGNVDLAKNDIASLDDFALGVVEDASIASAAAGEITVRRGAIISGYAGLTPGARQYVSDATAGALTESTAGMVAGEFVYEVGRALSATQLIFDPRLIVEL